jgi:hypothetical protein
MHGITGEGYASAEIGVRRLSSDVEALQRKLGISIHESDKHTV